jgi:hypothetical protein
VADAVRTARKVLSGATQECGLHPRRRVHDR